MKKLVAALVLAATATSANAALVTTDLSSSGDGLITRDTVEGLDWLDLTVTAGRSFNDVFMNLSTEFAGWRYATTDEVKVLWTNVGLGNLTAFAVGSPGSPSFQTSVNGFTGYFGDTYPGTFFDGKGTGASGIYDNSPVGGIHLTGGASYTLPPGLLPPPGNADQAWAQTTDPANSATILAAQGDNATNGLVGHYLVRASVVPIPAAAWLLMSGLGAIGAVARRRQKRLA